MLVVALLRHPHVLALPLLLTACATPQLQLPDELAPAERLEVEGMKRLGTAKELRFGSYRATAIDRSWTKGSGWNVAGLGKNSARQRYGFRFADGEMDQGAIACETTAQRRSMDLKVVVVDPGADVSLTCSLADSQDSQGWALSLASSRDRHLQGEISTDLRRYQVQAIGRGGKLAPAETHGFHLLSEGRVVAAVQTNTRGTVWLAPELDPEGRRVVALTAVALLLFEEPPTDS